eukprot:scaffold7738_cov133-Cylindrotheca_fusiformis.AAC.1
MIKKYGSINGSAISDEEEPLVSGNTRVPSTKVAIYSFHAQAVIALLLFVTIVFHMMSALPATSVWFAIIVVTLTALMTRSDKLRQRFGKLQRFLYIFSSIFLWLPLFFTYRDYQHLSSLGDRMILGLVSLYTLLSLGESLFVSLPVSNDGDGPLPDSRKTLSRGAMITMLKPYVWPDETSDSAVLNRFRASMTWVCVILSKICNLTSPLFLGWASTALAHEDYSKTIEYSILFSFIQFLGSAFKEGQSLLYLKVAQAAFVQLSETTFVHLHSLSLDWHLRKKLGEVIRSMDRGIAACDNLMKYLFLWLVPALVECLVVCIIFATYFQYVPLAVAVFYFVWMYIVWTIVVTLWRKKFRKAVVKSDNEWHDRCTDSLVNFETVKFFTAEEYECQRFGASVREYQKGSVNVQASLSFLNVSQRLILQICLAVALSMAAMGIKQRVDCCVDHGCDSGVSKCCQAIDTNTCPGMQVGDFVAVLSYVVQLFQPLNFLGSVYNSIVMSIIDLTNLSQLLAESPDVTDAPDSLPLPQVNQEDPDVAVEFDNVNFHYPTQPESKGLKGITFKMKRGTTTAIVGPTGAGKTTISRLFFRFYDVLGGAIKVNGKDVRSISQKSLRGAIGVVPQNVLDEATSALDSITENSIQEALDRLGNHRTVLVIAHRLGTIRNADNILVLKDGVVAEEGNHDQLLDKNGVYAEMWNMQLHSNAGSQVGLDALTE